MKFKVRNCYCIDKCLCSIFNIFLIFYYKKKATELLGYRCSVWKKLSKEWINVDFKALAIIVGLTLETNNGVNSEFMFRRKYCAI